MSLAEKSNNSLIFLKKHQNLVFLLILLVAFGIRLYYFSITHDQPLWWDEADYMSYARRIGKDLDINDIWYYRRTFFLPLFWGVMFKLGFGEASIRFTELLFGLGLVLFGYLVGKEIFNKPVGLIVATGLAFSRLTLFLGTKFLTEIPATFFFLAGLWFFWKGYVKKQNNKFIWLAGLFVGLAIFTRFALLLCLIPLGFYVFFSEKGRFWKNKHILIALLIVFLVLTPFFIKYKQHYGGISDFIKHYTDFGATEEEKSEYMGIAGIWGYLKAVVLSDFGKIFLIFMVVGCALFLDFITTDKIFTDSNVRLSWFIFLWILIPLLFHGMFSLYVEERYLLWTYPAFLMLIGLGVTKIYNFSKKHGKSASMAVLCLMVALIILNSLGGIKTGGELINNKLNSYGPVKDASVWIKDNSKPKDIVISNSIPQTQYYSERSVYMTPNQSYLESLNPKYIIVSIFENSPKWFYKYPEEKKLQVARVYFLDEAQTKPSLIVYRYS